MAERLRALRQHGTDPLRHGTFSSTLGDARLDAPYEVLRVPSEDGRIVLFFDEEPVFVRPRADQREVAVDFLAVQPQLDVALFILPVVVPIAEQFVGPP